MSFIARRHFFEFEDFKWLPKSLRATITDVLWFYLNKFKIYDPIIPLLASVLASLKTFRIVDLCSGSGGAVLRIKQELERTHNIQTSITLTDLFPNPEAIYRVNQQSSGDVQYRETSFDVLAGQEKTGGLRTMFTAFHHFNPDQARKVLANAVSSSEPIAVFEFTDRSLSGFAQILIGPPIIFTITPFMKPFSWKRMFWVYVLPLAPLILFWDGIVSCFRTYSLPEMQKPSRGWRRLPT